MHTRQSAITRLKVAFQVKEDHPALVDLTFSTQLINQLDTVLSLIHCTPANYNLRPIVLNRLFELDDAQKLHFFKYLETIKELVATLQQHAQHIEDQQVTAAILTLALKPETEELFNKVVEHAAAYAKLVHITNMRLSDLIKLDQSLQITILENAVGVKELIEMVRHSNPHFSIAELTTGSVESRTALCGYANELALLCSLHKVHQPFSRMRRRAHAALFESGHHQTVPAGTLAPETLAQIVNLQDPQDIVAVATTYPSPAALTVLQRLTQPASAQSTATASEPAPKQEKRQGQR
jgi:hypothetical protein